jgi:uncharacterized protein GlcG (DUF336 family)
MTVVAGGLPILADGEVVGGIGVSSGTPAQDLEVAKAGVQAFDDTQNHSKIYGRQA